MRMVRLLIDVLLDKIGIQLTAYCTGCTDIDAWYICVEVM